MNKYYMNPNDAAQNERKHHCEKRSPHHCFEEREEEKNIAKTEAKQVFNLGPISGSVIGNVTNNQVQVVVNLAFDEIEIEI